MSKRQLRLLLDCYIAESVDPELLGASWQDDVAHLTSKHLIQLSKDSQQYEITDKGNVYIEGLLNTPLPTKVWTSAS